MALDIVENYEPIAEDEIQELRLAEGVTLCSVNILLDLPLPHFPQR